METVTGEASKARSEGGEGRASSSQQTTDIASELELQASSSEISPHSGDQQEAAAVAIPPAPGPHDLAQGGEAAAAAERKEEEERLRKANEQKKAKIQKDIEFGAQVAGLFFSVAMTGFFLSPQVKGRQALYLDITMFLVFSSFVCGCSFMLLSMQLLSAQEYHISGFHRTLSRCLFYTCSVLPALTILCLLVVMPYRPYIYVGLAVLAVVAVPVALMHCYVSRKTQEATDKVETPDGAAPGAEEQKKMESGYKITSAIVPMSLAGLVGVLFGVYKGGSSGGGGAISGSIHVVIMCMFITSMLSMLLTMLSMKVLESKNRKLREFFVRTIPCVNAALLVLLAVAAFAASFGILKWYMLAAFVPLALAAIVQFGIQYCTTQQHVVQAGENETQIKWMADMARWMTAWPLGIVMALFGGFLGDDDKTHDKMVALKICMFLPTSAFVSGLGFMYLTMRPGESASGSSKAAMNILAWSAMVLLSAAALAVYGVEVMKS